MPEPENMRLLHEVPAGCELIARHLQTFSFFKHCYLVMGDNIVMGAKYTSMMWVRNMIFLCCHPPGTSWRACPRAEGRYGQHRDQGVLRVLLRDSADTGSCTYTLRLGSRWETNGVLVVAVRNALEYMQLAQFSLLYGVSVPRLSLPASRVCACPKFR